MSKFSGDVLSYSSDTLALASYSDAEAGANNVADKNVKKKCHLPQRAEAFMGLFFIK
jgi:hypothetical protein